MLRLDQEARVPNDNLHRECTLFFLAEARWEPAKSWNKELNSRKNRQEQCLGVASVITCACFHIFRIQIGLGMTLVEGYVHGYANIPLGSLKAWLPMNHRRFPEVGPELVEIEFEAI